MPRKGNFSARPPLPEAVRIGPFMVRVKDWDQRASNNTRAWGLFDPETQVILIAENLTAQKELEVFLHEVTHAIYDCGKLEAVEGEENVVLIMGVQLAQVVRDNPEFLEYLTAMQAHLASQ